MKVEQIATEKIFADHNFNCRGEIVPIDIESLKASIVDKGLLQPIVVVPKNDKFKVVMGHRRFEACKALGWEFVPANIRYDLQDGQAYLLNLIENLERSDLTIMQEARGISNILKNGYNKSEVAEKIGKSHGWVKIRYMALKLPVEIQEEINKGNITQNQIKQIYEIPSTKGKYQAAREIIDAKLRGEKKVYTGKVAEKTAKDAKERRRPEIFEMMDFVRDHLGNNLVTRFGAWAAGEITSEDFCEGVSDVCKKIGRKYSPPKQKAEKW